MTKIETFLFSSLLVGSAAMAMSFKAKEPQLLQGTTIGQYQKSGAPVDITYTSEHVDVGENSNVHVLLTSVQASGTMDVEVNIDRGLQQFTSVDKTVSFEMEAGKNEYPLDFVVSADEAGLYYVKLLVTMKGKGFRAFSVPVYVGKGAFKPSNTAVEKTDKGENISVSKAVETIEEAK